MTTVPEAQLAAEAGLIYGSLALITDYDVWRDSEDEHVSVEVVMTRLKELGARAKLVLAEAIKRIGQEDWTSDIEKQKAAVEIAIMTP